MIPTLLRTLFGPASAPTRRPRRPRSRPRLLRLEERAVPAFAAVGPEFSANAYTTGGQLNPAVAADADGDVVVAWQSNNQAGPSSGYDVYAQRFGASGAPLGGEFRVNATTTDAQRHPAVAADAAGDFVVAWDSGNQDGSLVGVYAQRYSAAGAALGTEFRANTYTSNSQQL